MAMTVVEAQKRMVLQGDMPSGPAVVPLTDPPKTAPATTRTTNAQSSRSVAPPKAQK